MLSGTSMPGTLIRPLMDNKISAIARSDLGLNLIVSIQLWLSKGLGHRC